MKIEEKKIPVAVLSVLIIMLGTWRVPNWDMREFLRISFLFCSTAAISSLIIIHTENIWIGLFLILAFIAHLDSKSITYTRPWSGRAFECVLAGVIVYALAIYFIDDDEKDVELLKTAICIVALTHIFFLILQYFKLDPFHISKRTGKQVIIGMLTSKNEVSALLGVSGICFFRKWWFLFLPLIIIGLVISKSFVGILSLAISSFIFILFKCFNKKLWYLILIYLLIGIGGLRLYADHVDSPSANVRIKVWQETIRHMDKIKYWIFGRGLGYFREYTLYGDRFNHIDSGAHGHLWWQTANNEFVQGLFEWGCGLYIILLGFMLNILFRSPTAFCLGALAGLLIACNCTYFFHNGVTAMIGIIELVIIEKELRLTKKGKL